MRTCFCQEDKVSVHDMLIVQYSCCHDNVKYCLAKSVSHLSQDIYRNLLSQDFEHLIKLINEHILIDPTQYVMSCTILIVKNKTPSWKSFWYIIYFLIDCWWWWNRFILDQSCLSWYIFSSKKPKLVSISLCERVNGLRKCSGYKLF